jgi:hypothetical protein
MCRCRGPDAAQHGIHLFLESIHGTITMTGHVRSTLTWHAPASSRLSSSLRVRDMMTSAYVISRQMWACALDPRHPCATNKWPDTQVHHSPASSRAPHSLRLCATPTNTDRTLMSASDHCVTSVRSVFLREKHFCNFATFSTLSQMC